VGGHPLIEGPHPLIVTQAALFGHGAFCRRAGRMWVALHVRSAESWLETVAQFGRRFHRSVGLADHLKAEAQRLGVKCWILSARISMVDKIQGVVPQIRERDSGHALHKST